MEFGSGGFLARASSDGSGECSRVERNVRGACGCTEASRGGLLCARRYGRRRARAVTQYGGEWVRRWNGEAVDRQGGVVVGGRRGYDDVGVRTALTRGCRAWVRQQRGCRRAAGRMIAPGACVWSGSAGGMRPDTVARAHGRAPCAGARRPWPAAARLV
ncbi:hypothetical protein GUJ93_ZPchr0002g25441 [Zizania palustris]|uniref:Uncharacterized protein n=1 Tax=Zizania palustris TaxID=103762 RepID=A0A8J5S306_ZIZPA|nr:hypothetical protein GUJ93_ZPchr0002g25441 [Zizania palustris]